MGKTTTLTRYLVGIVALFAVLLLSSSIASLWTLNATMKKSFTELNSLSALLASSRLERFFFRCPQFNRPGREIDRAA